MNPIKSSKPSLIIFTIALMTTVCLGQRSDEKQLLKILGDFPTPPVLKIDTIESVKLAIGWRYKIQYAV
jgi:hypothetical protein